MALETIIIAIHVVAAIAITSLVLLQRGKGAEVGASFGAGASQTMFGSMGSGNFLTKSTTLMAIVFFATSLGLAVIARQQADQTVQDSGLLSGDIEQIAPQPAQQQEAPAGDVPVVEEQSAPAGDMPAVEEETNAAGANSDLPQAPEGGE